MATIYIVIKSVDYENSWTVKTYSNREAADKHVAFEQARRDAYDEWYAPFVGANGYMKEEFSDGNFDTHYEKALADGIITKQGYWDAIGVEEQEILDEFNPEG